MAQTETFRVHCSDEHRTSHRLALTFFSVCIERGVARVHNINQIEGNNQRVFFFSFVCVFAAVYVREAFKASLDGVFNCVM